MREIYTLLNNAYRDNNFETIFAHENGIYFLKLRSLSRAQILRNLAERTNVNVDGIGGRELFPHLFCSNIDECAIDEYINELYTTERAERLANEADLYIQLYRLENFDWGGFYQNAVEQTLVNNYIKKITNYDVLVNRIENEITAKLRGYMLCSWYNNWTSILIEDMIKDHPDILPAVGLVKKVDFFWRNFPFDLKVTYFPDGYLQGKRVERGLRNELSSIKRFARTNNINYNRDAPAKEQFRELYRRVDEHISEASNTFIDELHQTRREIIDEATANPDDLIKWFYENQGTRRFDSANRFFIVLIDWANLEDSWKLKRNQELISGSVNDYLNENSEMDFEDLNLEFNWEGNTYTTYANCLFITHNRD